MQSIPRQTDLAHVEVLATNNRLKHLYRISDIFDELVAAAKGEVRAKITTAQGLEPEELEDIKDSLSKHSRPGVQHVCICSGRILLHVSLLMQFRF